MAKPRKNKSSKPANHKPRGDINARSLRSDSFTGPVIGAILALCAFSVAIVAGMYSGNSTTSVVERALLAMIVCYPVGLGVGWIGRRVVHEHTNAIAKANPVPQAESTHAESSQSPDENEHEEAIVV